MSQMPEDIPWINSPSEATNINPITRLILYDFPWREKRLTSQQIEADYNNAANFHNNYFVPPESWHNRFYIASRQNMLSLSEGVLNIVRKEGGVGKLISLFESVGDFESLKDQYIAIAPHTEKLYLIGGGLSAGISLPNAVIIDSSSALDITSRQSLEKKWVIAEPYKYALVAEEFEAGRYRGFFVSRWPATDVFVIRYIRTRYTWD